MPKVGLRLRLRLSGQLPLTLVPEGVNPPGYSSVLLHWDTDHGITEGDPGKVGAWTDRKAGVALSQGTGANQPTYAVSDYFKGKTVLTFGAANVLLDAVSDAGFPTSAMNAGAWTFVVACRTTGGTDASLLDVTDGGATTNRLLLKEDSATKAARLFSTDAGSGAGYNGPADSLPKLGFQTVGYGHDGAAAYTYSRSGGRDSDADVRDPQGLDSIRVGSRDTGGENNSEIAEIFLYDHALSADEWTAVVAYLDDKYRPTSVPLQLGASVHFDPAAGLTEETGVSAWVDTIGGYTVSQGTGSAQPTLVDSERAGHQMLSLDGAQYLDITSAPVGAMFDGAHTVYGENVLTGASARAICGAGDTATSGDFTRLSATASSGARDYDLVSAAANNTADVVGSQVARQGAAGWHYGSYDGASVATAGATTGTEGTDTGTPVTAFDRFIIGGRTQTGINVVNPWIGEIGHVVLFEKVLTTAEHTAMQTWLESLWDAVDVGQRLGALHGWDPAQGITEGASGIAAHLDYIGGLALVQGTGADQPQFVDGDLPYVEFDGVSEYLSAATPAATQAFLDAQTFTMYAAVQKGAAGEYAYIGGFDSTSSVDRSNVYSTAGGNTVMNVYDGGGATAISTGLAASADGWVYGAASGAAGRSSRTSDGAEVSNTTDLSPLTTAHTSLALGVRLSSTLSQHFDGRMYKALIFGRELNAADHAEMQADLDLLMGL